jgi:ribonuclease HII
MPPVKEKTRKAKSKKNVDAELLDEKEEKKVRKAVKDPEKIVQLLAYDAWMSDEWVREADGVLIGTDEVGRGCLAGPVVAAAVLLPNFSPKSKLAKKLVQLDDSKKLQARSREELAEVLQANCRFAIGEASVEEIDQINILQASFLAMRRAIEQLSLPESSTILVDGNKKIGGINFRQVAVVGGDGISASIAAASVIAKVHRDNFMRKLHKDYPHYEWASNKGYGSKDHRNAINEYGLTEWHRKSFCAKLMHEQLSILV